MPEEKFLEQAAPGANASGSSSIVRRETRDSTAKQNTEERRRGARYQVSISAEIVEPRTQSRFTCRVTDLSMGGCYVDTINPLQPGMNVHIRLSAQGREFRCEALVLYETPGLGMALAFTKLSSEHYAMLGDWFRALGGDGAETAALSDFGRDVDAVSETSARLAELRQAVLDLVGLLARRRLLTESETRGLQDKLWMPGP
jgi:hypothetical protein